MKTFVLIGLLALALAAPVAAAHIVIGTPDPLTGECTLTYIGDDRLGVHGGVSIAPCGPIMHPLP